MGAFTIVTFHGYMCPMVIANTQLLYIKETDFKLKSALIDFDIFENFEFSFNII